MFSFIQITDHHLPEAETMLSRGYSPWHAFRRVMRHIAERHGDVDFIVTTGDVAERGVEAEYTALRRMLGMTALSPPPGPQAVTFEGLQAKPMYFMPGNHDPRDAFFRTMFETPPRAEPGMPAINVAFTHKGVQFVCVDWGEGVRGQTSEAMLSHLARCLDNGTPSIVLSHHNVTPAGDPRLDALAAADVHRFAETIRGRNVLAVLNGHTHATYEQEIAGIPVYGLRSTHFSFGQIGDEWCYVLRPPHYRVVTVADGHVTSEIVEVTL